MNDWCGSSVQVIKSLPMLGVFSNGGKIVEGYLTAPQVGRWRDSVIRIKWIPLLLTLRHVGYHFKLPVYTNRKKRGTGSFLHWSQMYEKF